MKRIYLFSALCCFLAVSLVFSCKKKKDDPTYDATNKKQLFSGLNSKPQSFTVKAGRDTIIVGADSTMLHFYTNSFKDASGNIITSGTINIQLIEMYKPGSMIANQATTTANGQLLTSGGQVNIKAAMNGQEIFANKYGIGFRQAAASTQPMELYYGGSANADSVTTWSVSDTTKKGTTSQGTIHMSSTIVTVRTTTTTMHDTVRGSYDTVTTRYDSSHTYYTPPNFMYIFDTCTQFNWINCDQFSRGGYTLTTINVVVPDNSYNSSNTNVYLALPSTNSVMQLYYNFSSGTTFSTNNVPVGLKYEIVVITSKSGSFYFYEGVGTTTDKMTVSAAMGSETMGDIIDRLKGL